MRQQTLSNKDWQLLSEYMDGQLSPREKARLEQRISERDELRTALDELRRTRAVLRSVKLRPVPRNFTLTPSMLPQPRSNPFTRLVPVLNFASLASAVAVVIVLAVGLLPGLSSGGTLRTAQEAPAAMEAAPAAAPGSAQETPMIIQWQAPYGLGGGGGQAPQIMAEGMGSGEALPDAGLVAPPVPEAKGLPDATELPTAETPTTAQPAPQATQMPAASAPLATQEPEMTLQMAPTQPAAENRSFPTGQPESVSQAPLAGAQPILGVRPADEAAVSNRAALDTARERVSASRPTSFPWIIPVILALIAVGSWLTALILRRKYSA